MAWPTPPLDAEVSLALGADLTAAPSSWVWTPITTYVRQSTAHSGGGVRITRGRRDEQSQTPPSTCTLALDNRDGRFSPRNPLGAYYGQIGRNTPLRVRVRRVSDTFTRTESNGWGTSDSGHTYTTSGGAASDYATTGTQGQITQDSVAISRYITTGTAVDCEIVATFVAPATATGASINQSLVARYASASNNYEFRAEYKTDGNVTLTLNRRVAGTFTALDTAADHTTYTPAATHTVRFQLVGSTLRGKFFTGTEPAAWDVEATDTNFTSGAVGFRAILTTGNTNTAPTMLVDDFSVWHTRFTGYVSEWPQRWIANGADFWVPIRSDGVSRRLGQGSKPINSALHRTVTSDRSTALPDNLVAYWPCEESSGASVVASPIDGVGPLALSGTVEFAAIDVAAGTAPLPDFTGGGSLSGTVPAASQSGTNWGVHCVAVGTDTPATVDLLSWRTGGLPIDNWKLSITSAGTLQLSGGGSVLASGSVTFWDGLAHSIVAGADNSGSDVVLWLYLDGTLVATPTQSSQTAGFVASVRANPSAATSGLLAIGHIAIYDTSIGSIALESLLEDSLRGEVGESAWIRVSRLCEEDSIALDAPFATTEAMGAQGRSTLLALLRECEAADSGLLVERMTGELGFDPRALRYNQEVALTLDYDSGHFAPAVEPTDDDLLTRNYWTVARSGGTSRHHFDEDGPLGVNSVGLYDEATTLNVESDDRLQDLAGWRVGLGTVDELRWPRITLNLRRNYSLIDDWLACDIGSRIQLTNLPTEITYDDPDLIIEGYTELLDSTAWNVELNCAPASPYTVAIVEDTADDEEIPRVGSGTAVLASGIDDDDTSLSVTTGTGGLWTTAAGDFPLDVNIGGERIRLSAISGTSSPQTFTVSARSVNGVVWSHSAGAQVEVWKIARIGL